MDFGLVEMAKTSQVMELIQFLLLNMFSPKIIKIYLGRQLGGHLAMNKNIFDFVIISRRSNLFRVLDFTRGNPNYLGIRLS